MNLNILDSKFQLLAIIVILISAKFYFDHRKSDYEGKYRRTGVYKNISTVKHDMTKQFWIEFFLLLIFGLRSGQKFYDYNNFTESWVGSVLINVASYFTYYELFQPYFVNEMPSLI